MDSRGSGADTEMKKFGEQIISCVKTEFIIAISKLEEERKFLAVPGACAKWDRSKKCLVSTQSADPEGDAFDESLGSMRIDKNKTGLAGCAEPVQWDPKARAPRAVAPAMFE